MYYREYLPSTHLAPYVQCYWVLRSIANPFPTPERLIPDGTIELIFNFGSPYKRYQVEAGQGLLIKQSHLVGQRAQYYLIEQLGAIDHIAIRFKAGGLCPFVGLPVSELTNYTPDADLIFGPQSKIVEDRLFEAATDDQRITILEDFLTRRLTKTEAPAEAIYQAIQQIIDTGGNMAINTLAGQFGYSQRQLERKFLAVVGITPKFYSRIVRFTMVFDQIKHTPHQDWNAIAADCGYYDQAHFIKNFKSFTGLSPARFFAQRRYIAEMLTASPHLSNFYNTNVLK